jgi:hypothetical protein
MDCTLQYESLPDWTNAQILAAIERGDPGELLYVPLVASMEPTSRVHAEQICLRFASHSDPNVRCSALEGFGHIARIFRSLNKRLVQPAIEAGMNDPDEAVRGTAEDTADEIEWFCGWIFRGREDRLTRPVCPFSDD